MFNRPASEEFSKISLSYVLNVWVDAWLQEQQTSYVWFAYSYPKVRSKLTGFFYDSKLWNAGAYGIQIVLDRDQRKNFLSENDIIQDEVKLRGVVVICCQQRIKRDTEVRQGYHHKHAIRLIDIYNDLLRYASSLPSCQKILLHLRCEGETVIFSPCVSFVPVKEVEYLNISIANEGSSSDGSDHGDFQPPSEESDMEDLPPPLDDEDSVEQTTALSGASCRFYAAELASDETHFSSINHSN